MADPIRINALNQVGRASVLQQEPAPVFYNYGADFALASNLVFDFKSINQGAIFGVPKSCFVDNGTNPSNVDVIVSITGQTFTVPAYAQGYFTINANISSEISFITDGGANDKCNITIYNYDVAPNVWYTFGTFNFDKPLATYGTIQDGADIATAPNNEPVYQGGIDRATGKLEGISVDATGRVNVNVPTPLTVSVNNQPARQGAYTNRSIAALSGASEVLMPANANRRILVINNVSANKVAVNLTGGAAVIDSNGSITIAAGGSLILDTYPPTGAITIIGTAADKVTAYEG